MRHAIPENVPAARLVDFDLYQLAPHGDDFFTAWQSLQRPGGPALFWTPHNGGHWIATDGKLIADIFADIENFSSRAGSTAVEIGELTRLIPVQSDPPLHAQYRTAVMKGFGAKLILALEPDIRARTRNLIASFKDHGRCEFMSEFAEDLPVSVFLSLIALPLQDRPRLREIVTKIHRPDGKDTPETLVAAMTDYLRPYVLERLARPGPDLMSRILAMPLEGRAWSEDEAMRLASNLLVGGLDTVAALLGFTMEFLATHPAHRAQLVTQPALIPKAADEFTRRFAPTIPVRVANRDYEIDGVVLKQGDLIALPTMLHNLDERITANATAVDFARGNAPSVTMGNGPHRCVGAGLARQELIIVLEEFLTAIPDFTLAAPPELHAGGVGTFGTLKLVWA